MLIDYIATKNSNNVNNIFYRILQNILFKGSKEYLQQLVVPKYLIFGFLIINFRFVKFRLYSALVG